MPTILSVMIDSREPEWVQQLKFGGVPTAVIALDAGDFLVATDDSQLLAIERKTSDDLLNTIAGDRLFPQVSRLREVSKFAYLLITGPLNRDPRGNVITERVTGWNWDALQGALLTVQELGVNVIYAAGDNDLEAAIVRLAARKRDDVTVLPPRLPNVMGAGEACIAALPGIGVERLGMVLEATGTPLWALIALTDQAPDEPIPGIGPGVRRQIRHALGMEEGMELTVIPSGAILVKPSEGV